MGTFLFDALIIRIGLLVPIGAVFLALPVGYGLLERAHRGRRPAQDSRAKAGYDSDIWTRLAEEVRRRRARRTRGVRRCGLLPGGDTADELVLAAQTGRGIGLFAVPADCTGLEREPSPGMDRPGGSPR